MLRVYILSLCGLYLLVSDEHKGVRLPNNNYKVVVINFCSHLAFTQVPHEKDQLKKAKLHILWLLLSFI